MEKTICELFAGVGGFRLGFDRLDSGWQTTWFSQWEPGAKTQWAHECYLRHYGDSADLRGEYHTCEDIASVDKNIIPNHTLLVGGFPCQDYSVAHSLVSANGIEGKKGVLWWQIRDTLIAKKAPFCIFENVDRLIKSPAKQRGRDFGVILACLSELGYSAEWRVVNAAQYGAGQRRRRTFIFAYANNTVYGKKTGGASAGNVIGSDGFMVKAFPVQSFENIKQTSLPENLVDVSNNFAFEFENAGYMHEGIIYTAKVTEREEPCILLGDILQNRVDERYYISNDKMPKWIYLKGAKKIPRKSATGHEYIFSEGPIAFPDPWDRPGRTMLTSEGTLNRSTHIVTDPATGRLRLLTPVETERLQGFDDGWTNGMPDRMRYFCMGNALVVPMIERMGKILDGIMEKEPDRNRSERGLKTKRTEYRTKEEVLKRAQAVIGIRLGDIDKTGRLSTGKGAIGTVIEESWFGYTPNSESEPDFPEAGVELKVTPYTRGKNGIRAKERLVCNIINYMEEYDKDFRTGSFWHKCNTMLLMPYEHNYELPKSEYKIDAAVLFGFPEEDLLIIEQDWKIITDKIRSGKAHELSEGDTLYLAACTKGANALSVRRQPFSDIPAKQRAYSLKASYMTQVLNKYVFGDTENERVVKNWRQLRNDKFENILIERLKPFFGKTQKSLIEEFGIKKITKNINEILLAKMLGVRGRVASTEEFQKAGIVPKTVRVNRNGKIKENMSFPSFGFVELSREKRWEESALYNYLAPAKFFFVIFKESDGGDWVFDRVKFWNIPNADLEEVGRVWERTVKIINDGVELTPTQRGVSNNLPKQSESAVAHVRPHGINGNDKLPLPDGRMMTKQCFWLNNSYIEKQIAES